MRLSSTEKTIWLTGRHSGFVFKVAFVTCTGARACTTVTKSASVAATVRIEVETQCLLIVLVSVCQKPFPSVRSVVVKINAQHLGLRACAKTDGFEHTPLGAHNGVQPELLRFQRTELMRRR